MAGIPSRDRRWTKRTRERGTVSASPSRPEVSWSSKKYEEESGSCCQSRLERAVDVYMYSFLMTSSALRCGRVAEEQVAKESAESHSEHDPAIVCHEEQPDSVNRCRFVIRIRYSSHDEERVKDLDTVESGSYKLPTSP